MTLGKIQRKRKKPLTAEGAEKTSADVAEEIQGRGPEVARRAP
jgi:hypothetical protein